MCGALLPLLALDCLCSNPYHHRHGCGCEGRRGGGVYFESETEQISEYVTDAADGYRARYKENAGGMRFGGAGGCGCRN